ncbi:hypothetical protein Q3G72_013215 [Acer saccharum]|nr:hypothetical protein Q3G72_013215 [Acer saccharum]
MEEFQDKTANRRECEAKEECRGHVASSKQQTQSRDCRTRCIAVVPPQQIFKKPVKASIENVAACASLYPNRDNELRLLLEFQQPHPHRHFTLHVCYHSSTHSFVVAVAVAVDSLNLSSVITHSLVRSSSLATSTGSVQDDFYVECIMLFMLCVMPCNALCMQISSISCA